MVYFPNAKINIGLNVVEKRPDGFHNLETVFCPVNLTDILEIVTNDSSTETQIELTVSGIEIDDNAENNICSKYRVRYKIKIR